MTDLSEAVRKRLAAEDVEFNAWVKEHREHEGRLAILATGYDGCRDFISPFAATPEPLRFQSLEILTIEERQVPFRRRTRTNPVNPVAILQRS